MKYRPAKDVALTASKLISQYHAGLMTVPIVFVYTDEAETVHGKPAIGNHLRVSGRELFFLSYAVTCSEAWNGATTGPLDAFATDPNGDVFEDPEGCFLVSIFGPAWAKMTDEQKLAVVDHELCHCEVKPTKEGFRRVIRPHDVEEFAEIIERHGAYMPNVAQFVKDATVGQGSLDDEGGED